MSNMILLSITCPSCGTKTEILVGEADWARYQQGALVQEAFPYLNAADRESIISHLCEGCQDMFFSEDLDQDDDANWFCDDDDPNLEMGFDPYEGTYTYDC